MIWCRIRKLIGPTALGLALISTPAFACIPGSADSQGRESTPEEISEGRLFNQGSSWRAADAVYLARLESADWDLAGSPNSMGSERTYVRISQTPPLKGRAAPDRVTTRSIVCASVDGDPFNSLSNFTAYHREASTFIVFATRYRGEWSVIYAIAPDEAVYQPLVRRLERGRTIAQGDSPEH